MMDYDCRSSEKRLAAVENDWLWTAAAKYAANVWKG